MNSLLAIRKVLCCFLFSGIQILFLPNLYGDEMVFESGEAQVPLVELFSSEGCSSCPPAEKWMRGLRKDSGLWTSFVPVEFHVDYWNQLGWVDPFSNKSFSRRQRKYAKAWRRRSVATPSFVKNGQRHPRGKSLIRSGPSKVGPLKVEWQKKGTYKVQFRPKSSLGSRFVAVGALLGNGLSTTVPRGENAGRVLDHEFVVLKLGKVSLERVGDHFEGTLALPEAETRLPKTLSVAFWVTRPGQQKPLQAVGGDLKKGQN